MIKSAILIGSFLLAFLAPGRADISLSKNWRVQAATSSTASPVEEKWDNSPKGNANSYWYEQKFAVPSDWKGQRAYVDFHRIEGDAIIFVNNKRIGEVLRPGGPIEITPGVIPDAENTLRIFITRDYTDISRNYDRDYLRKKVRDNPHAPIPMNQWSVGIIAPVIVSARPVPAGISDIFVQTSWRKKQVDIDVEIDATEKTGNLGVLVKINDKDGKEALSFERKGLSVEAGVSTVKVSAPWSNPILWELDAGYLYTAKVTLTRDGIPLHQANPVTFGFREIWTEGRKMMMNGHETRWRLAVLHVTAIGAGVIDFHRLIGYNAGYFPSNPDFWWARYNETPVIDEALLDEADRQGFALSLGVPSVSILRESVFNDPELNKQFAHEMDYYIRRYRNRPAILGWIVAMNSYIPEYQKRDAISAQGMGRQLPEELYKGGMPKAILTACELAKKTDPTRLAYATGDGNIGDIATTCMYLNFTPLQEREEWPMEWSKSGNMPYMAYEFGMPYTANFWKSSRFMPTEYIAMYFGDDAYLGETKEGLSNLITYGVANTSNHGLGSLDWSQYPIYWKFQDLFVRNTNRAFRMWDFNGGWAYFNVGTTYGIPAGKNYPEIPLFRLMSEMPSRVPEKPSWANPNFDIHTQANRPALVYLAGWPIHTDKTHLFYSDETIKKSIGVVWDGPGELTMNARWSFVNAEGKELASGTCSASGLDVGSIRMLPISFKAPKVDQKTTYSLKLTTEANGKSIEPDTFEITVYPRAAASMKLNSRIAIYDPVGKSTSWIQNLGVNAKPWKPGDSLSDVDLLIIGREALREGDKVPFAPADIDRGLKVIIFEQLPVVWNGLGFRTTESMSRIAFPTTPRNPILLNMGRDELCYWRGVSDLLPPAVNQHSEIPHAQKWTNTHGISSSTPQIPRVVGFSPIVSSEFDQDYSPLMEWRSGTGKVMFCSFDLTGRVGVDPGATILAENLLKYMDSTKGTAVRRVVYSGDEATRGLLTKLGVDPEKEFLHEAASKYVLVLGPNPKLSIEQILTFAKKGGHVLALAQNNEWLAKLGIATQQRSIQRVSADGVDIAFPGVGPKYLRWRDRIDATLIAKDPSNKNLSVYAEGLIAKLTQGKGKIIFCQVEPSFIVSKYPSDKARAQAVELSGYRLEQLLSILLTQSGVHPSSRLAERLSVVAEPSVNRPIANWNIMGPFPLEKDGPEGLSMVLPGEQYAIDGQADPDVLVESSDGKKLDWRRTVRAKDNGFVDLSQAFNCKTSAVGYAIASIFSETDRNAMLRVGCDWRMIVWLNGQEVFRTTDGQAKPNAYRIKIKLKKGKNSIGIKVASGTNGFGFYADVSGSETASPSRYTNDAEAASVFYGGSTMADEFDPYQFTYW